MVTINFIIYHLTIKANKGKLFYNNTCVLIFFSYSAHNINIISLFYILLIYVCFTIYEAFIQLYQLIQCSRFAAFCGRAINI